MRKILLALLCLLHSGSLAHSGEANLAALKLEKTEAIGGVVAGIIGTVLLDAPAEADLTIPLTQSPAFVVAGRTNCFDANEVQQTRHPVAARGPDSVRIAAGQREGKFKIETFLVEEVSKQSVAFTATLKEKTQSATLTLTQWSISSFKVVRNPSGAAAPYTAHLALDGPAPFDLMVFLEGRDGRRLRTPDGTTIAQRLNRGTSSTSIAVHGSGVCNSGTTEKIVADPGCRSVLGLAESGIDCEPPPGLSYISIQPQIVTGGSSSQGEVGLFGPTPIPVQVALTTSSTQIQIPASVTVPAGQSKAVFQIRTFSLPKDAKQVDAEIFAEFQRNEKAVIRIMPQN